MSNQPNSTEVKTITYHETRQQYTEEVRATGVIATNSFKIKENKEKIIHNGNTTIIILNDGTKGVAKCSSSDGYNRTTGIKIAYLRAKIESLQKELSGLTK